MLSYKVREYYTYLNREFEEFEINIEMIIEFGNKYKQNITESLKKIYSTQKTSTSSGLTYYGVEGGGIIGDFKEIINDFKSRFNAFDVFSKYTIFKNNIKNYIKENEIEDSSIKSFFNEVDSLFNLYQSFIQSNNDIALAIDFGKKVIEFKEMYKILKVSYKEIENNLIDIPYNNEGNSELKDISIQLLNIEYSFEEFIENLQLINKIYCEVGNIIYGRTSYVQAKIVKIESGSLLSKILGDKNIIEAIGIFLNKSTSLIFNKFTYEGKIIRHSELRKELLEDTKTINELKVLGYDVEEAKKNNNESLTMLTKDLLSIAKSSSKIKIDEKEYKIKDEIKQKYINSVKTMNLPSGMDNE